MLGMQTLSVAIALGLLFYAVSIFALMVAIRGDGKKIIVGVAGVLSLSFILELIGTYWPF